MEERSLKKRILKSVLVICTAALMAVAFSLLIKTETKAQPIDGRNFNYTIPYGYTGFALDDTNTWYYIYNGRIAWGWYGLAQGLDGNWYFSNGGYIDWNVTGLAYHYGGWFYVDHGKVNWGANTLCQNQYGWWKVTNGVVDFNFTGLWPYNGGWFFLRNGYIDWGYNGLAQGPDGNWYHVKGGMIDWSYSGPSYYMGGLFQVQNGFLNWGTSGKFKSKGREYVVKNGIIVKGWVPYLGGLYYSLNGFAATETHNIDGRLEVFRTDGRLIDTTSMDNLASYYNSWTNYLILVSLNDRVTKIYQRGGYGWYPVQSYLCTVGDTSRGWGTVKGDFYVGYSSWNNPVKRGYSFEDSDGHTLYYWTRFCDSFLFHSILYDRYTYNESAYGNELGEELSHGCVRMRIENAKWINQNIPDGTRVIVY